MPRTETIARGIDGPMPPDGTFCISSRRVWRPGSYDSQATARRAQKLTDEVLQRLQTAANERAGGTGGTITAEDIAMANESPITSEFQRGWDAALRAVRNWHESQANKTLIQARRSRFPKNLERDAEVHKKSAELIGTLSPDDV